jgi:hypothetical protein
MTLEQLAEIIDRLKMRPIWDEYKDLTIAVITMVQRAKRAGVKVIEVY